MTSAHTTSRRARIITVSDRSAAGTREDLSGPRLAAVLLEEGFAGCSVTIVPDDAETIAGTLRAAASEGFALVVTTGGTGLAPRDVTPEATLAVCDRLVPGLAEVMRADGLKHTRFAPLSRGVCGICGSTLILNVPGSPAGAESSLRAVLHLLPHSLDLLAGQTEH